MSIILTNFITLQIQEQSPIGFLQKMFDKYVGNIQQNTHTEM